MTRPTDEVRGAVRASLAAQPQPASPVALVGCSGGADSLALAAGAAQAGRQVGWSVAALVVDHGLQPDSAAVAERAAAHCRELGLEPVLVRAVDVPDSDQGPEAAARTARYQAFAAAADELGASALLLAHTLDDQAESVLLGLARGSGSRSLAGMARARPLSPGSPVQLLRPMLAITRETVLAACKAWGLNPWEDPHNADPAYTRVRVRRTALPALAEALGPGVPQALARSADLLRDDDAALTAWAQQVADQIAGASDGALTCRDLATHPAAIRRRVLRQAAHRGGVPTAALTAVHLRALDDLVGRGRPGAAVRLPGGVEAVVRCGRLEFARRQE